MEKYGQWEVMKELGEGGQGKVYLAKDIEKTKGTEQRFAEINRSIGTLTTAQPTETRRQAAQDLVRAIASLSPTTPDPSSLGALKILHKPKQENGIEKALERMTQEIDALQTLNHPNVLRILDHNVKERWFVGEYHPGGTLSNHNELFKGDLLRALTAFRPLVEAVAELHRAKRVHRDIKPHNVFIAADGRLILGDFGIVFYDDPNRTRITDTYENVGSRDWMPGWAMGRRIEDTTAAFDVFGLGKLLWAMLSGRTVLPLWYLHKPAYELEQMFPQDESIRWARVILDKCIVENEELCLTSAAELLTTIDAVLPALKRHAQVVGEGIARRCTVCGIGEYQCIIDEDIIAFHNFGLDPTGSSTFKVFSCSNCGHVELFHIGNPKSKPRAWKA